MSICILEAEIVFGEVPHLDGRNRAIVITELLVRIVAAI